MKNWFIILLCVGLLQSCIQNDIIDDRVDEAFSITNTIQQLTINNTYQYTTKYTDNVGKTVTIPITWTTSNSSIATISNSGLVTAVSQGEATITATVTTASGKTIMSTDMITVTMEQIDNNGPKTRTGTIMTTSSYKLAGTFTLREIPETDNLELIINSDYVASASLPGLYLYLTNNVNTINNAQQVSAVSVFNGAHTYTIQNTGINDFSHLLYWCKPFSVKVGQAEIKKETN